MFSEIPEGEIMAEFAKWLNKNKNNNKSPQKPEKPPRLHRVHHFHSVRYMSVDTGDMIEPEVYKKLPTSLRLTFFPVRGRLIATVATQIIDPDQKLYTDEYPNGEGGPCVVVACAMVSENEQTSRVSRKKGSQIANQRLFKAVKMMIDEEGLLSDNHVTVLPLADLKDQIRDRSLLKKNFSCRTKLAPPV